ncbi:beta-ketoacyl-ACP synthase III [Stieleria varia]|uniref:Beta-ketoacyl-[acyl-carrier-protein] synthase III n=1 Tax=Stieleria varia TaxID=2528005 RepID=A0A5C5ZWQ3_9BACT|nr:beta-ketoacyl-ACP synthase III [Stieleria varia]TWT92034.1 3-oxoacyl-[acyl-carrier-protein] synthase 3 [Stieleria varia]
MSQAIPTDDPSATAKAQAPTSPTRTAQDHLSKNAVADGSSCPPPSPGESSIEATAESSGARRGRMGAVNGVRVLATGSYVPPNIVTNEDLAALGCDSEWIIRRTGIRERRRASDDQATSDLCYEAALRCMETAGVTADQIDLIIVATITPDHPTPSTACHLQRRLGCIAPSMDVNAACAGFMYAMTTAAQFVAAGNSKCALVVGADLMSRTVNPDDKKTYPLFGDGAGAVLLAPDSSTDSPAGILSYQLGSEGCGGEMLCIPAGGTRHLLTPEAHESGLQYLTMDGRGVFKWAVRVFDESAKDVLETAGIQPSELALVVLHQANQRIIDSAVADLGVERDRVFVNLDRYGNTSGASIPLALDEAIREGKLQRGDKVLLCGFGAGLAWGTAVLQW